jgi:hypothetical protein
VGLCKNVKGQNGVELERRWKDLQGPEAYLGVAVPGVKKLYSFTNFFQTDQGLAATCQPQFPNYFIVVGPNAIAGSWGYTIGTQVRTSLLALSQRTCDGRLTDYFHSSPIQSLFIAKLVKGLVDYNLGSLVPRLSAHDEYNRRMQENVSHSVYVANCTSWWKIRETGKVTTTGIGSGGAFLTQRGKGRRGNC